MSNRIFRLLILLSGLALLLLPGCGSSENKAANGGKEAMSEISRTHELKIAVHPFNIPFEFGSGTSVQGLGVDVGDEIAKALNVRPNWMKAETFDQVFAFVDKGEAQMAISSISVTEDRKKQGYLFSEPYYKDSGQIIVIRSNEKNIKKLSDLAGKKVGVQENSTGQQFLESQKIPNIQISKFRTLDDALVKVSGAELDAVVGDKPIVSYIIFWTYPKQLQTVGDLLTHEPYAVMTRSPEIIKVANETIKRLEQNGQLAQLTEKRFKDLKAWQEKVVQDRAAEKARQETPKSVTFRLASSAFAIDRLDGHQIHMQGSKGNFTSSHIVTSGRSGSCSVGRVPPGKYHLSLRLIQFGADIEVPADASKSLTYNINFGQGGASVQLAR